MSNKYTYSVPFTEEQLFNDYVISKMSQHEIANKYGTTQKVVWRAMNKMKVPTRLAFKRNQLIENNDNWKGGRVLQGATKKQIGEKSLFGNGYYYILMPEHPNATKIGYVAEHIFVVSKKIGRPLQKGECVHHINLNKWDNREENLIVKNRKDHSGIHQQLQEVAVTFFKRWFT